jgi:REP element-mobilizing transposase RayT
MPQSFTCLNYHVIFSTIHRQALITHDLQPRLYNYIGGILRDRKSRLLVAGGVSDHVHLLISLSKQVALSAALRDTKAISSGWVHKSFPDKGAFAWQTGYGSFSVSYSNITDVKRYITNQEDYHLLRSFKEEFVEFLARHDVQYDEKYLWE